MVSRIVNGTFWAYERALGWHDPKELLKYMTDHDTYLRLRIELDDTRFRGRVHGHHKTYEAGCAGPLCSDANKFRSRDRHRAQAEREGRTIVQRSATHVRPPQIRADQDLDAYREDLEAWIEDRQPKTPGERRKAREEANRLFNQTFNQRWREERAASSTG